MVLCRTCDLRDFHEGDAENEGLGRGFRTVWHAGRSARARCGLDDGLTLRLCSHRRVENTTTTSRLMGTLELEVERPLLDFWGLIP